MAIEELAPQQGRKQVYSEAPCYLWQVARGRRPVYAIVLLGEREEIESGDIKGEEEEHRAESA